MGEIKLIDEGKEELDRLYKYRENTELSFNKQIVYLAGGGLVLTIGFVDKILKVTEATFIWLLLLTWILFALTLILNLLSFITSKKDIDSTILENEEDRIYWRNLTERIDLSSVISLLFGLLLFIVFVTINIF